MNSDDGFSEGKIISISLNVQKKNQKNYLEPNIW